MHALFPSLHALSLFISNIKHDLHARLYSSVLCRTPDCDVVDVVAAPVFDGSLLCIVAVFPVNLFMCHACLLSVFFSIETVWDRFAKRSHCT